MQNQSQKQSQRNLIIDKTPFITKLKSFKNLPWIKFSEEAAIKKYINAKEQRTNSYIFNDAPETIDFTKTAKNSGVDDFSAAEKSVVRKKSDSLGKDSKINKDDSIFNGFFDDKKQIFTFSKKQNPFLDDYLSAGKTEQNSSGKLYPKQHQSRIENPFHKEVSSNEIQNSNSNTKQYENNLEVNKNRTALDPGFIEKGMSIDNTSLTQQYNKRDQSHSRKETENFTENKNEQIEANSNQFENYSDKQSFEKLQNKTKLDLATTQQNKTAINNNQAVIENTEAVTVQNQIPPVNTHKEEIKTASGTSNDDFNIKKVKHKHKIKKAVAKTNFSIPKKRSMLTFEEEEIENSQTLANENSAENQIEKNNDANLKVETKSLPEVLTESVIKEKEVPVLNNNDLAKDFTAGYKKKETSQTPAATGSNQFANEENNYGPEEVQELIKSIRQDAGKTHHEKQIQIAKILSRKGDARSNSKKLRKKTGRYWLDPNFLEVSREVISIDDGEIDKTRTRLEKTLSDYKIRGHVVSVEKGPILTIYEVQVDAGTKVSSVLAIQDEIKMNLRVVSVRVVAPIPGKSTIGIEIPNKKRSFVNLGDLLCDPAFKSSRMKLPIALGKDISGKNTFIDLHSLPHFLIAGATGSGKSVIVNSMLLSILYRLGPDEVKFILIDPKVVEMQLYNHIPHLLMPVITDVRDAAKSLAWVVMEMEKRYTLLSALKSRDIASFNDKVSKLRDGDLFPDLERIPYIVVIIDELSDLMMVAGKEVEGHIIRLTQKARAVGIHLIMATQRPSVDVITALIKANCPARLAMKVSQKTDSRTILDAGGAETLLGMGDLLYRSPTSSVLKRIQSPFVSEDEVARIVEEIKAYGKPEYIQLENEDYGKAQETDDQDEELFNQALEIVKEAGKASASYFQRRLRIGYNRAARVIELMEERGYIGPQIGAKPREILKNP